MLIMSRHALLGSPGAWEKHHEFLWLTVLARGKVSFMGTFRGGKAGWCPSGHSESFPALLWLVLLECILGPEGHKHGKGRILVRFVP